MYLNTAQLWSLHAHFMFQHVCSIGLHYASPSSGEAYRDRQLTTNFEFWVEIFCVPTCFHMRIPKPCLSICPYPEKRNYPGFVNIGPTLVIDTSMERSSRVLQHAHGKCEFYKIEVAKARKISSVKRHFPRLYIQGVYKVIEVLESNLK